VPVEEEVETSPVPVLTSPEVEEDVVLPEVEEVLPCPPVVEDELLPVEDEDEVIFPVVPVVEDTELVPVVVEEVVLPLVPEVVEEVSPEVPVVLLVVGCTKTTAVPPVVLVVDTGQLSVVKVASSP
jgi:hypothetical protein